MTPDARRWVDLHRGLARHTAAHDPRVEVLDGDGLLASWRPGVPHALYVLEPSPALPAALVALPDLRWVWVRQADVPASAPVLRSLGLVPWSDTLLAMLLDDPVALRALRARRLPPGIDALDVDAPERLPLLRRAVVEGFGTSEKLAAELEPEVSPSALARVAVDADAAAEVEPEASPPGPHRPQLPRRGADDGRQPGAVVGAVLGAVLGAAKAQPCGPGAVHVRQVCTVPAARRRGVAAGLVGGLLERFDATTAVLAAAQDGVATWEALGFRAVDAWTTFSPGPAPSRRGS